MKEISDIIFERALSLKWHVEPEDIIRIVEEIREENCISFCDLTSSFLALIADENLVSYAYSKDFIHTLDYTHEDVILELKGFLWNYLFPTNKLTEVEKEFVFDLIQNTLRSCYSEGRWLLVSDLILGISKLVGKEVFNEHLFIDKLFLSGKVETKKNEGIDINGYKEFNMSVRWKKSCQMCSLFNCTAVH